MSTRATYGLFSDWYFDIPPSGERVYWAIPIGQRSTDPPTVLYSELSQGESVGTERAVHHVKVTGTINPEPFEVDGKKYATSFSFSQHRYLGYYNYRDVYGRSDFNCQLYEDGLEATETTTVDEGFAYYWQTWTHRSVSTWSFDGGTFAISKDIHFDSYDGGPEEESSPGQSWRRLSGYWTGDVTAVTYNWPLFVNQLLDKYPCEVDFDNLIVEAADQMKYSANNLDNVRQFADVADSLVRVLTGHAPKKALKRILHGTSNPRAFGRELKELSQSAWLTNRYVINTTKSDVEDFLDKVGSIDAPSVEGEHIIRAGDQKGCWTCHVKIRSRDRKQNALAETHRWAMQHGFGVTPANLWDMIPFSFMVDWFIPIGETLNAIDAEFFFHSAYYEILSYTASRKFTMDVKDSGNTFHVTVYTRDVSDKVPIVSSLTYEDPSSRTVRNRVIDASAIFL